jgi:hypothetical protein
LRGSAGSFDGVGVKQTWLPCWLGLIFKIWWFFVALDLCNTEQHSSQKNSSQFTQKETLIFSSSLPQSPRKVRWWSGHNDGNLEKVVLSPDDQCGIITIERITPVCLFIGSLVKNLPTFLTKYWYAIGTKYYRLVLLIVATERELITVFWIHDFHWLNCR